MTFNERDKRRADEMMPHRYVCKCSHVLYIAKQDYTICSWCGRRVYSKKGAIKEILKKMEDI